MEKETQSALTQKLDNAAKQVQVGARYVHYKQKTYKVLSIGILEANNEPCVIYQAEYGDRITFIRSLSNWIEKVIVEGKRVDRFTKINEK